MSKDPPATLDEPDADCEVIAKLRERVAELQAQLGYTESIHTLENQRLRNAVWAAIPWLDDLQHMGSLVDQDRRAATAALLEAAVRSDEQSDSPG